MEHISVRNWERYQHYKDRNPPWVKLHVSMLEDDEMIALNTTSRLLFLLLLCIAGKRDNKIPNDPSWLAVEVGLAKVATAKALDELKDAGFVVKWKSVERESWPTRYVNKDVREAVLNAAGHMCLWCSARENLEIDHVIPVSKGGNGEIENLQVLCRSCNRKKRSAVNVRSKDATQTAGHLRRNGVAPETETETETENRVVNSSTSYVEPARAIERLLNILPDADPQTATTVRSLCRRHRLAEGDVEWARECATGPGVNFPSRVAVGELVKRGEAKAAA